MADRHQVALLPGLDGSGELFTPVIPCLDKTFDTHVIRYGDEGSFEDYVDSAWAQLPSRQPLSLVAESFSGPIAIALLARHPERFSASVLSATFCKSPLPLLTRLARYMPRNLYSSNPLSRLAMDRLVTGRNADPEVKAKALELLQTVAAEVFQKRINIVNAVNVAGELAQIEIPLLYLQASRDRIVLQDSGIEIMKHAKHLRLEQIEGSHMILQTRPQQCADLIIEHLNAHCRGA